MWLQESAADHSGGGDGSRGMYSKARTFQVICTKTQMDELSVVSVEAQHTHWIHAYKALHSTPHRIELFVIGCHLVDQDGARALQQGSGNAPRVCVKGHILNHNPIHAYQDTKCPVFNSRTHLWRHLYKPPNHKLVLCHHRQNPRIIRKPACQAMAQS
jgi:hypothetical protein